MARGHRATFTAVASAVAWAVAWLLAGVALHPAAAAPPGARAAWDWPLRPAPRVSRPFRAPPVPWAAGHRGVDLAAVPGQHVLAPADGVVTFAGRVVDRGIVTVSHGSVRSSVEPVDPVVAVGAVVRRGQVVAVVSTATGHCPPRTCLHWGVRRGDAYVDPLRLVPPPQPPVLLPLLATAGHRPV